MSRLLTVFMLLSSFLTFAQESDEKIDLNAKLTEESIEDEFDVLVEEWEKLSEELATYEGLETYCTSDGTKSNIVNMLGLIHHYDSLVLNIISDPTQMAMLNNKEQKATKKEIEEFESEYSTISFLTKLKEECKFRRSIEKEKKYSKNDIGANSYSGQRYILESDLRKYVKHIDSRVEHIDDHVHKLHLDDVRTFSEVNE